MLKEKTSSIAKMVRTFLVIETSFGLPCFVDKKIIFYGKSMRIANLGVKAILTIKMSPDFSFSTRSVPAKTVSQVRGVQFFEVT